MNTDKFKVKGRHCYRLTNKDTIKTKVVKYINFMNIGLIRVYTI